MGFKTSQTGIDLIKSFEGCALKAYRCPAGVWTIGYGHTGGVKEGQTITQAQAEQMLRTDLGSYEQGVIKAVNVRVNQNQFDALVSFAYNCGVGALNSSSLLKKLNQGNYTGAANELLLWTRGGGRILPGLVRRRKAEKELFLTPSKEVKEDKDLKAAAKILHTRKVISVLEVWENESAMKLEYVPGLLKNMGGIDRLVKEKIITDRLLWEHKQYNTAHVRALLIKYSKLA